MKHVRLRMTLYSERFFFHVKSSLYPLPLWWKKRGRFGFWKLWLLRYLSASFSHCKKLHTKMALQNIVCLWINISISASIFLCDYRRYLSFLRYIEPLILYTLHGWSWYVAKMGMHAILMDGRVAKWREKKNKSKCHRNRLVSMNEWSPKRNEKVHLNFHAS